jgi:hypothetical protein
MTIIIDGSLMPVTDEEGKVVFIAAEGRDIPAKPFARARSSTSPLIRSRRVVKTRRVIAACS